MKKEQLLDLYYQMVLIRRVEERGAELYQAGKIGGFMHLYIGQEAVSTGLIAAREPRDRVITAYRDHGVALNCGISANEVMAELLAKRQACPRARAVRCTWQIHPKTCGADTPSSAATSPLLRDSRSAINTRATTTSPSACSVMAQRTLVISTKL
jgi:TPP-dependent pyruvate/acetoin dehydrogenase alpha subunit